LSDLIWTENQKIAIALDLLRNQSAICPIDKVRLKWMDTTCMSGPSFSYTAHCPLCGNSFDTDSLFEKIQAASISSEQDGGHTDGLIVNHIEDGRACNVRIFVSHSSEDVWCVKPLVELLRIALRLSAAEIRCTSLDGYRLRTGVDTDEQLRAEVHDSEALVGVISPCAIKSVYVIYELGARWGAGKRRFPLIVPGEDTRILQGPLKSDNTMCGGNVAQVHQLLDDLAGFLGITMEKPGAYQEYIEKFVKAKSPHNPESDDDALKIATKAQVDGLDADLLLKASEFGEGEIYIHISEGGTTLRAGVTFLNDSKDKPGTERCLSALVRLNQSGLLRLEDGCNYVITGDGWDEIDRLNAMQH